MNHNRTIRNDLFRHEEGVFTSTPAHCAARACVYIVRGRDAVSHCTSLACYTGGLYFAKTDSAKSENLYRNVVNRTLPNQETDKPYSAKSYSGIC